MKAEVIVKKFGNSFRLIFSKEVFEREGLKENEKIFISILKE